MGSFVLIFGHWSTEGIRKFLDHGWIELVLAYVFSVRQRPTSHLTKRWLQLRLPMVKLGSSLHDIGAETIAKYRARPDWRQRTS